MRNFTVIEAEQRSETWFAARVGRVTGSNAGKLLAKIKSGEAADRRNYRVQLVLERLTGKPQDSGYQNFAMQQGLEREPLAIAAYEAQTGLLLEQTGFLSHNALMIGCSLDGHLGDFEALASIKCRQPAAHYEFLRYGTIPVSATAQMAHELFVTGASQHTYVSWQPDFPEKQQLKFVTFTRDLLCVPAYEDELMKFLGELDAEMKAVEGWTVATAEAAGVA